MECPLKERGEQGMADNLEAACFEFSRLAKELLYLGDDSDFDLGGAELRYDPFPYGSPANPEHFVIGETSELRPPNLDAMSKEELMSMADAISPQPLRLEWAS